MRSLKFLSAVMVPLLLACGGLPQLPQFGQDAETPAEPPAGTADAIADLEKAIDRLDAALARAEAAEGLDPARVEAARARLEAAATALEPVVQKSVGSP